MNMTMFSNHFIKIDKSRGGAKSSVGLGLSIASDIVRSHGGNIILEKSPHEGLRVKVFFSLFKLCFEIFLNFFDFFF